MAEAFISLVEGKKMLYDKSDVNFKNAHLKDAEWRSIGSAFKMSGKEAQTKFKALRQKYIREKNMESMESRSGAGSSKRSKWSLMPLLKFLDDHIKPRKTSSTFSCVADAVEDNNIIYEDITIENGSESWTSQAEYLEEDFDDDTLENSGSFATSSSASTVSPSFVPKVVSTPAATTPRNIRALEPVKKRSKRSISESTNNDALSNVIFKLSDSLENETNQVAEKSHIKPQIQAFGGYITEQLNRLPENISDYLMAKMTNMVSEQILESLHN